MNPKNSMSMKISIELPFFPGLYESALYNSDTAYWAIKEELEYYYQQDLLPEHPEYEHLTEDDLDFNFEDYSKDVVAGFVEVWGNHAPDIVESVEFDTMISPKYYNFSTDRLFAFVELKDGWEEDVRTFMAENADWLRKRVKEDWTSYDGFDSYMSNNFDDTSRDEDVDEDGWLRYHEKSWYWHLFSGKSDRYECYLSTIIGYMMYRENKDIRDDLAMGALEDIYAGSYVYITEEGQARLNEIVAQREEDIREGRIVLPDPAQLELPFTE